MPLPRGTRRIDKLAFVLGASYTRVRIHPDPLFLLSRLPPLFLHGGIYGSHRFVDLIIRQSPLVRLEDQAKSVRDLPILFEYIESVRTFCKKTGGGGLCCS